MTTHSEQLGRKTFIGMLSVVVLAMTLGSWATAKPAQADMTFNAKMLEFVNQQRALVGVASLQSAASLASVAEDGQYDGCGFGIRGRAKDMGNRNYFSHTIAGCGTQGVFNMLGAAGVQYGAAGENIAWMNGTTDPLVAAQRLTNDLMASPPHRANILNADFTHVGIGSWTSAAGQFWTGGGSPLTRVWITAQVFARVTGGPTPTPAPAVGTSPTSLAFGDRTVGVVGATQTATVSNTGNAPLTVSSTALSGANAGDFSIASNTCGTVAAGSSCAIGVTFKPVLAGARSATLTITDNAGGSPHSASLTGTGLATIVAPGAPTNMRISPANWGVSVSWTAPVGPGVVDGYWVYIYDAGSRYTGLSAWVCATCTSATVTGLANGQSYFAAVFSHSSLGLGGVAVTGWVIAGPPQAPANVTAVQGNGQVTVSWSPAPVATMIDTYALLLYDSNGYTSIASFPCGTCTTGTLTGLTNGRTYTVAVYAHNTVGWGLPTNTTTFVPTA